jgi:T6SS, Phospholipase effector Tle1-like, catalytic domain
MQVMGGYQFLMQNYRTGDRVSIFGFSRGAYTARALAGMLYKASAAFTSSAYIMYLRLTRDHRSDFFRGTMLVCDYVLTRCRLMVLILGRIEQVSFAYQMYKATGKKNDKLANGFKQTFCKTVQIDFMGCW